MKTKVLSRHIETLKKERELLFRYNENVFEIHWSDSNGGWYITGYSEIEDKNTGEPNLIVNQDLCALCKGSEKDAILFFIEITNFDCK